MNEMQLQELLDGILDNTVTRRQLEASVADRHGPGEVSAMVQQHTLAAGAIEQFALLQSIKNVRAQYEFKPVETRAPAPVVPINWLSRVAAVAAMLTVGLALWMLISLSGYTSDEIYSDLNESYSLNTARNSKAMIDDQLVSAFRQNDFQKVIALYQIGGEASSRERFFAGYSYMQLEDYTSAAVTLERLLLNNTSSGQLLYNDDAEYYLALSRMQLGNYESAFQILKRIYNQPAHTYNSNVTFMQLARLWMLK